MLKDTVGLVIWELRVGCLCTRALPKALHELLVTSVALHKRLVQHRVTLAPALALCIDKMDTLHSCVGKLQRCCWETRGYAIDSLHAVWLCW